MDLSKMRTRIQKTESGPLLRQGAQKRSRRLAIGYKRVRRFAQIICATSADTAAQLVRLYRQRITSYYLPPYGVFSFNLPLGKTIQPVTKETSPGLCFLGIVTRILILCLRISNFPCVVNWLYVQWQKGWCGQGGWVFPANQQPSSIRHSSQ